MTALDTGFHAKGGWFFRREDDGLVTIQAPDSMGPGAHQVVTLDANTWASVVASVSVVGEDSKTFNAAYLAHMDEPTTP